MALSYLFTLLMLSVIVYSASASYGYGSHPNPNPNPNPAAESRTKEFLPRVFILQGIIYCKSGPKLHPLKGGVVRITCLGVDRDGYEMAPSPILTRPTDSNGYLLAKLSTREDDGYEISQCKAFLHSSPVKTCQFGTDANKGLSGAPLSVYRPIGSSNMRMYSLGPFVYTSEPQPTPTVY